jgi:signal transduction histidine kinase
MLTNEFSHLDTTDIANILTRGPLFKGASLICLALAVPIYINVAMDFNSRSPLFASGLKKTTIKPTQSKDILTVAEMTILLVGAIILPIISFLPKETPNIALLAACCYRMQNIFVGGVAVASMCRFDKKYFPTIFSVPILLLLMFSCAIGGYSNNYTASHPDSRTDTLYVLLYVTVWLAAVSFILLCLRWMVAALFLHRKQIVGASNLGQEELLGDQAYMTGMLYYRLVYCATVAVWVVIRGALNIAIAPTVAVMLSNDTALMWTVLPYIFFQLSILVFGLRLVKHEAVSTMYALLESKKAYVRYISHELRYASCCVPSNPLTTYPSFSDTRLSLTPPVTCDCRTPMNTACLGLGMLIADLAAYVEDHPAARQHDDWLETVTDVHMACTTTVDILNDLLGFEKMESGQMTLHASSEPALSFVNDCLAMFIVHARSKGINLVTDYSGRRDGDGDGDGDTGVGVDGPSGTRTVEESDLIDIDKFKVAQVLRNLVSNAVKFTPKGGTVCVRLYAQREDGTADLAPSDRPTPALLSRMSSAMGSVRMQGGAAVSSALVRLNGGSVPASVPVPVSVSVPLPPLASRPEADAGAAGPGPDGDEAGDIEAGRTPQASRGGGGYLVVQVTDSGAGISKENQARLFTEVLWNKYYALRVCCLV